MTTNAWAADCGHRLAQPGDAQYLQGRRLCPRCGRRERRRLLDAAAAATAAGQQDISSIVDLPAPQAGQLGGLFEP